MVSRPFSLRRSSHLRPSAFGKTHAASASSCAARRAFLHVGHVRLDARAVRAHLWDRSSGSGRSEDASEGASGGTSTSRRRRFVVARESARGTDLRFTPRRTGRQSRGDSGGLLRRRRARRSSSPVHRACATVTGRVTRWTKTRITGAPGFPAREKNEAISCVLIHGQTVVKKTERARDFEPVTATTRTSALAPRPRAVRRAHGARLSSAS